MNKEEILKNNKLIAEFMDREVHTDGIGWFDENFGIISGYEKSWDKLMKVVEKIENLREGEDVDSPWFVTIGEGAYCRIFTTEFKTFQDEFIVECTDTKLNAVFIAVVEFIKWYNKQKN